MVYYKLDKYRVADYALSPRIQDNAMALTERVTWRSARTTLTDAVVGRNFPRDIFTLLSQYRGDDIAGGDLWARTHAFRNKAVAVLSSVSTFHRSEASHSHQDSPSSCFTAEEEEEVIESPYLFSVS